MKDVMNKNANQDVAPAQMLEAEDENGRELADGQLKDVVGGITMPQIPQPGENPIEVRGPLHNPFA